MRIIATPILAQDLKPGDLFSTADQGYWDRHPEKLSIGEKVYIRTETPCPQNQAHDPIYRIEIVH